MGLTLTFCLLLCLICKAGRSFSFFIITWYRTGRIRADGARACRAGDTGGNLVRERLLKDLNFCYTMVLCCLGLSALFGSELEGPMLLTTLPLFPKLIAFIAFFADIEHDFFQTPLSCCCGFGPLGIATLVLLDSLARFRVDMDNHTGALITIVSTLKLLEYQWRSFDLIISVAIQEALLDEVKAFASFCLVLLSYMLWSVSKAGLFEKVVLRALVEARVAIVFVGAEELHWIVVLSHSQLIKLIQWILFVSTLLGFFGVVMVSAAIIMSS